MGQGRCDEELVDIAVEYWWEAVYVSGDNIFFDDWIVVDFVNSIINGLSYYLACCHIPAGRFQFTARSAGVDLHSPSI
jgi:hypothetical protein